MLREKVWKALDNFDRGLGYSITRWPVWFKALTVFLLDWIAAEMEQERKPIAQYLFLFVGFVVALGAFTFRKRKGTC